METHKAPTGWKKNARWTDSAVPGRWLRQNPTARVFKAELYKSYDLCFGMVPVLLSLKFLLMPLMIPLRVHVLSPWQVLQPHGNPSHADAWATAGKLIFTSEGKGWSYTHYPYQWWSVSRNGAPKEHKHSV